MDKAADLPARLTTGILPRPSGGYAPGQLSEYQQVENTIMKPEIHPSYQEIKVVCSCGNEFTTKSTLTDELHIDVCSSCHPFYTGQQKIVDTAGRVDKFRRKYNM